MIFVILNREKTEVLQYKRVNYRVYEFNGQRPEVLAFRGAEMLNSVAYTSQSFEAIWIRYSLARCYPEDLRKLFEVVRFSSSNEVDEFKGVGSIVIEAKNILEY